MTRSPAHSSPRRPRDIRRRGVMLVEILITVFLTAMVAGIATQVVMQILKVDHSLSDAERSDAALDRAVQRLRRDVERTTAVATAHGTLTLDAVTWTAEANTLVRREGESSDGFEILHGTPTLASADGVVTLNVAGRLWAFRPLIDAGGPQ